MIRTHTVGARQMIDLSSAHPREDAVGGQIPSNEQSGCAIALTVRSRPGEKAAKALKSFKNKFACINQSHVQRICVLRARFPRAIASATPTLSPAIPHRQFRTQNWNSAGRARGAARPLGVLLLVLPHRLVHRAPIQAPADGVRLDGVDVGRVLVRVEVRVAAA